MRLSEFAAPVKLLATKRYIKNAAAYARGYPAFAASLRTFLTAKLAQPLTPTGKKDEPFTGNGTGLKELGLWHAHIIHGKVVVIYKSTASSITLYDVAEHDNFEGKHQRALADFVAGADVQPIDAPVTATVTLTPDQHKAFADLLAFMAEQDRDILDLAVKGDFAGLKEFVALIPLPWAALEATHGGRTGMRKYIKSIL